MRTTKRIQVLMIVLMLGNVCFCSAQLPSYVPANGLYGWYSFTTNAYDLSGNGHDGINNGATLVTDRFGIANSAYSFNGSNNNIVLQNSSTFDGTTGFSLTAWVNFTDNTGGRAVISKHANFWENGFSLIATDNKAGFAINNGSPQEISSPLPYNDGNWHFYTGVFDGTNMYVYADTILVASMDSVNAPIANTIDIRLGMDSQLSPFNGLIDDAGIWNRALTQSEIVQLFLGVSNGIHSQSSKNPVIFFHDLSNNHLQIDLEFSSSLSEAYKLEIVNSLGQIVYSSLLNQDRTMVDLSLLESGIYFATAGNSKDVFSRKLIMSQN